MYVCNYLDYICDSYDVWVEAAEMSLKDAQTESCHRWNFETEQAHFDI